MSIVVFCTRCGAECEARELSGAGLCGACALVEHCERWRIEYRRLWAKRARYLRAGAPTRHVENALLRQVERIRDACHAAIPNHDIAREVLNRMLAEDRERALSSRLLVPA